MKEKKEFLKFVSKFIGILLIISYSIYLLKILSYFSENLYFNGEINNSIKILTILGIGCFLYIFYFTFLEIKELFKFIK